VASLPPELPPLWTDGPPSRDGWPRRAAELVAEFERTVYGSTPPGGGVARVLPGSRERGVLGGRADRLRHQAVLAGPLGELTAETLLHLPAGADREYPVVVALNFTSNDDTIDGEQSDRWPYARIVEAGFAVVTADYRAIEPDDPAPVHPGVRGLFPAVDGGWGAIGAWAWGISRLLDVAGRVEGVAADRAVALGHSRLGKAALWAGAQDARFAVTVSNDSGCGGASLFRHRDPAGEDIAAITTAFPHWFVPSFASYAGREEHLPVDQHQLLAAIAPRRVWVASAVDDRWADPLGEHLAVSAAAPAFGLYGFEPGDGIGHHLRSGGHDLTEWDWTLALAFARRACRASG
jgi:hypothetical protein